MTPEEWRAEQAQAGPRPRLLEAIERLERSSERKGAAEA